MKYFIALVISLIGLFVFGIILETEYAHELKTVFIFLTLLFAFLWEYSVLGKIFESDFKLRSQRKSIGIFDIGYALCWTLFILFLSDHSESLVYLVFAFWAIPFAELMMWFVYKKQKPFTLFINGDELILNNRWTQKRNLTELTQIRYDRFSKNLKLYFKSKSHIPIKTKEYHVDDIQKLFEILIEKSEYKVSIPQNYEPKLKNSN
ncbi:hypothetical protein [Winogradskyella sp.]|uniref:hypothetical protein n=1 Tax=Winogradskyella sp. TaxID=1883156 RepID=UPI003BAD9B3D